MNNNFDFNSRTASLQAQPVKSIQAWKTKSYNNYQAKQAIEKTFEHHLTDSTIETRTAFAPTGKQAIRTDGKEPYTFSDVIDIVNPLQHLPVIGMLYRGITGDKIKPTSQIIGGAIFGGPIGAVTGTVNAIAQIQTGKDVADNVLTIAGISTDNNEYYEQETLKNDPENRLNAISTKTTYNNNDKTNLPGTALAFANLAETGKNYIKVNTAEGRTAGSTIIKKQNTAYNTATTIKHSIPEINLDYNVPAREKITEISLSSMPKNNDI